MVVERNARSPAFDAIVLVSGSAGTRAGMLAGMIALMGQGHFGGIPNKKLKIQVLKEVFK